MRKFYLLLLVFYGALLNVSAQKENNIWAFGTHAGLDFNNGSPTAVLTGISGFGEANASVCDAAGQLLFCTEGSYVWNRNGTLMPNGSLLTAIPDVSGISATTSTSQGALIVPVPGAPKKYYVFSMTSFEFGQNGGKLYYSVVDMNLNGGLGDIVATQKGILLDVNLTEKMIATTGEHCNIWLLTTSIQQPVFKAFEITDAGINTNPVISNVGTGNSVSGVFGTMAISPNRKKIALAQFFSNCASTYDFDVLTGNVSNPMLLMSGVDNAYGVCFSPDNTKLYVSRRQQSELLQFDLSSGVAATIIASRFNLGFCDFSQLRLGPDGKIYFLAGSAGISVISNPNFSGVASNVQYGIVPLVATSFFNAGLPNQVPVIKYDSVSHVDTIHAGCFVTELTLQASNNNGWNYTWSNGVVGTATNVDAPGTYYLTYRTAPCKLNIDSFIVDYPYGRLPQLLIQPSCSNAENGLVKAIRFTGDTIDYHYTWLNSSNDTLSITDSLYHQPSGNYTLHINTINCDTSLSFFIPEEHYAVSFESPAIVCIDAPVTFQNTSENYYTQFHWYFGTHDSAIITNPVHAFPNAGSFDIVLVGKGVRCVDTASRSIIVDPKEEGLFELTPKEICMGASVRFLSQPDSTATLFKWQFGDESDMVALPEPVVMHAYDKSGTMSVTLSTSYRACPDVDNTGHVTVYELPKVDLGADSFLCLKGGAITLSNKQPLSGNYHCSWSTGDTSLMLKVVHPGTYSLTIMNEPLGCSSTESIVINKDCYIDIPNAFTPNGDGVNDFFFPRQLGSRGLTAFYMQILNRWGQVIFETQSIDGRGWDGNFNQQAQPEGVYLYRISADMKNGEKENYQGNITLIR